MVKDKEKVVDEKKVTKQDVETFLKRLTEDMAESEKNGVSTLYYLATKYSGGTSKTSSGTGGHFVSSFTDERESRSVDLGTKVPYVTLALDGKSTRHIVLGKKKTISSGTASKLESRIRKKKNNDFEM